MDYARVENGAYGMETNAPELRKVQRIRENMRKQRNDDKGCGDYAEELFFDIGIDFKCKIQNQNFDNQGPLEIGFPAGDKRQNRRRCDDDGTEEVHGKIGFSAECKYKTDQEESCTETFENGRHIIGGGE